jgi:hypothetical protein
MVTTTHRATTTKLLRSLAGAGVAPRPLNSQIVSIRVKNSRKRTVAVIDAVTTLRPGDHVVPNNVFRLWNRYQRNGPPVLPLGFPSKGDYLTIVDPGRTIANQQQLDTGGRIEGDDVSILGLVGYDFFEEFFK